MDWHSLTMSYDVSFYFGKYFNFDNLLYRLDWLTIIMLGLLTTVTPSDTKFIQKVGNVIFKMCMSLCVALHL